MFCTHVPFNQPGLGLTRGQLATILGDYVAGPGTSTDNAIARFDGTTGKLIQNSNVTIDDSGNMVVAGNLTVSGTTTTINSTVLDVTDKNITVNKGGSTALSGLSGVNIEGDSGLVVGFFRSASDSSNFEIKAPTGSTLTLDINADKTITVGGSLDITGDSTLSGTNTGNVTLTGQTYLSIVGQLITANAVDLSGTNVTGTLAAARFPALTGDVTTSAGSLATTLATVNSNVGTFGDATHVAQVTVNGKGLVTAVSNITITGVAPGGSAGGDLSGTYPNPTVAKINNVALGTATATSGNLLIGSGSQWVTQSVSGDITINSTGVTTLATVNSNVGSFGSSTAIPSFTVNGKGLITAASTNVVIAPAGTLTGTTLASNVVTSSLTTVGTIGTGVWHGTVIGEIYGGTAQSTYTLGDTLYASAANTLSKLAGNTTSTLKVLTQTGTGSVSAAPVWTALSSFGVTSITGTANQISASASTGAVTLSIPSAFVFPATIASASYASVTPPSEGGLIYGNTGLGVGWTFVSPAAILDIYQDFTDTTNPTLHTLGKGATISTWSASNPAGVALATTGSTNSGASSLNFEVGSRFTVSSTIYITHLGFFDDASYSVFQSGTRDVGLYDGSGNLLASATISSGTGSSSGVRYNALTTAVKLTTGQTYTILGACSAFQNVFTSGSTITWASPITFVSTVSKNNQTGLAYYTGNDNSYSQGFGPGFKYTTTADTVTVTNGNVAITGTGTVSSGLRVGFTGTATASRIELNDTTFYLDKTTSTLPLLNFDTNDYLAYNRTFNYLQFLIGSTEVFRANSTGLLVNTSIAATAASSLISYVGTARNSNYTLVGNSFDGSTDTDGIGLAMVHNSSGNRQLAVCDTAKMTSSSSFGVIRIIPGGSTPIIDAVATDASTLLTLQVGNSTGGVYSPGKLGAGVTPSSSTCTITANGAVQISNTTTLPAATNTSLYMAGNYGSPVLGRLYVGDGTGWYFQMAKRTGSTDTALFYYKDNGYFGIGIDPTSPLHLNGDFRVQGYALIRWTDTTGNNGIRFVGSHITADSDVFSTRDLVLGSMTAASTYTDLLWLTSDKNASFFGAGSFGGGTNVVYVANRTAAPSSNPVGGAIWYVESGASKARGSSGTITTFANADPHCPECGTDYVHEWENEEYGYLAVCVNCLTTKLAKIIPHTRCKGAWDTHKH